MYVSTQKHTLVLCGLKRIGTLAFAVSNTLAAASPTLHLADQSHQLQQQELAFHHSLSGQLSQHAELSQGSYPPWLLQSSNPGLCIPDSVGTQSPLQRDRQLPAITAASPMPTSQQPRSSPERLAAANLQQQEAHKRNAAALQELMTQADASEPDADDVVADSAADHAPADADVPATDRAATLMQSGSSGAAQVTKEYPATSLPAEPAQQLPQGRADGSRGAGTPAGPQEEFYSPQEHFHGEASEQHDELVHPPSGPEVRISADNQARPALNDSEEGAAADDQTRPAPSALTPLDHKTPAPTKRRKGSKRYSVAAGYCWLHQDCCVARNLCRMVLVMKEWPVLKTECCRDCCSIPPSSKRRKATPAALAGQAVHCHEAVLVIC